MDLLESDGSRIPGESSREQEIRAAFNLAVPTTPKGHRDRIMHGSQAAYGDYSRQHTEEIPVTTLYRPEAPLTAFVSNDKVFRLETVDDALNFYTCTGASLPVEWYVELGNRDHPTSERKRLH